MSFRTTFFRPTAVTSFSLLVLGALLHQPARAEEAPPSRPVAVAADAGKTGDDTAVPVSDAGNAEISGILSKLPPAPAAGRAASVASKAVIAKHVAGVAGRKAAPGKAASKPARAIAARPTKTSARVAATTGESLRDAAKRLGLPLPLPDGRVVVKKAERRLEMWSGNTLVKTYRVALGSTPSGHKVQQGDGRTPEGEFFICTRNSETSSFHIFLGLSYPAMPDATRGLKTRAITQREFLAIRSRLASRNAPLWRTRLGGWVGIHGGTGQKFANKQTAERKSPDWTAGCVALTNREIEEIHAATVMGTPVSVRP